MKRFSFFNSIRKFKDNEEFHKLFIYYSYNRLARDFLKLLLIFNMEFLI